MTAPKKKLPEPFDAVTLDHLVRWLLGNLPRLCVSWGVGLPADSSISAGDG